MEGAVGFVSMQELITSLTPMIDYIMEQVPEVANTIVASPLMLMTTGFLIVGGVVGIFGRFLSKG